jgi:hypothetical protein
VEDFKNKGDDFFLADLAEQIHRNAQIAAKKLSFVSTAMKVAFAGSLFWVVAVALLVIPK